MPHLDQHSLYELDILEQVERNSRLTNRLAAGKLGVSIKLAHEVLKRMVQKGYLHVKVVHARRWDYFLTPKGISEKTRLTLEFLDFSMHFYREARRRSAQLCKELASSGCRRVAFLGAGDLAEIVYLGVQEWGLELTGVYDDNSTRFMGARVRPVRDLERDPGQSVIVCLYDPKTPMRERYLPDNVAAGAKLHWVFEDSPRGPADTPSEASSPRPEARISAPVPRRSRVTDGQEQRT